jgi:hypothetical protein
MYISKTDSTAVVRTAALLLLDDSAGSDRSTIYIPSLAGGYGISIRVSGPITEDISGTWITIPVVYTSGGLPADNDPRSFIGVRNGVEGVQGAFGVQGATGPQGFQGATGPQGVQGLVGPQGVQGVQGLVGPQGFQGVIGIQGSQGRQGFQGAPGPQGFQGVIGAQGFQGAPGPQGFQGVIGVQGVQGAAGVQGATGVQGSQGITRDFFTFGGTSTPTTGTAVTPYVRVMASTTCVNASLVAKTAPSGGSFVVAILRSADNGATFPTTVATITVTTGNRVGTVSTTTALSAGDLLRLDITSVNGAADWTAQLYTQG